MTRIQEHRWAPAPAVRKTSLLLGFLLALLAVGVALAAGIDPTNKWAWGNVGWINFAPDTGGVTVFSDHLEGDAWGENIGWIRLKGTAQDSTSYGVNNDGVGNLSGYAWGTNVGWINFAPTNGGVWADPVTGDFEGYAWGENVGWIHFQNASPAYKVTGGWRGDLTATYQNGITAIITTHRTGPASSSGLDIANSTFLQDAGDGIIFGHNNAAFAVVTDHLTGSGADKRWARIWQLDVNDGAGTTGGNVTLTFDLSDAGGSGSFSGTGTYYLLKRAAGSTADFAAVPVVSSSVSGDRLTFTVAVSNLGSEFTVGAAGSPLAVRLADFRATAADNQVVVRWETVSELDVQGFHLYRAESAAGPWQRLDAELIPSAAPGSTNGHAYAFNDSDVRGGRTYWYRLEAVDLAGGAQALGVTSVLVRPTAATPRLWLPWVVR